MSSGQVDLPLRNGASRLASFVPPAQRRPDFSPVAPAHRAAFVPRVQHPDDQAQAWPAFGPGSNTGQKTTDLASQVSQLLFDFCSVVVAPGALKTSGCLDFRQLLDWIFGTGQDVVMGAIVDRTFQFYPQSATLIDRTGTVCGKVGFAENGQVFFSLSGQGCQHVRDWKRTHDRLVELDGKLTRVDIACDDLSGEAFHIEQAVAAYFDGQFTTNGRPPKIRGWEDFGSNDGRTLYIGKKGHKELCMYERDKMLGKKDGSTIRCELRLYAKHVDLPLCVLLEPERFFRGAYPYLADLIVGEVQRLQVREHYANVTAEAEIKFQRTQVGRGIGLLFRALGGESAEKIVAIINDKVARHDGPPGRFKDYSGDLENLMRMHLTREDDDGEDHDYELRA